MFENGVKPVRGYKKPRGIAGRPSINALNRLQCVLTAMLPPRSGDRNSCIQTCRAGSTWPSPSTCSRAMKPSLSIQLPIGSLLAVWRRKPAGSVLVHSDQGANMAAMTSSGSVRPLILHPTISRSSRTETAVTAPLVPRRSKPLRNEAENRLLNGAFHTVGRGGLAWCFLATALLVVVAAIIDAPGYRAIAA
jgi:hypothetical protein